MYTVCKYTCVHVIDNMYVYMSIYKLFVHTGAYATSGTVSDSEVPFTLASVVCNGTEANLFECQQQTPSAGCVSDNSVVVYCQRGRV